MPDKTLKKTVNSLKKSVSSLKKSVTALKKQHRKKSPVTKKSRKSPRKSPRKLKMKLKMKMESTRLPPAKGSFIPHGKTMDQIMRETEEQREQVKRDAEERRVRDHKYRYDKLNSAETGKLVREEGRARIAEARKNRVPNIFESPRHVLGEPYSTYMTPTQRLNTPEAQEIFERQKRQEQMRKARESIEAEEEYGDGYTQEKPKGWINWLSGGLL